MHDLVRDRCPAPHVTEHEPHGLHGHHFPSLGHGTLVKQLPLLELGPGQDGPLGCCPMQVLVCVYCPLPHETEHEPQGPHGPQLTGIVQGRPEQVALWELGPVHPRPP